MEICMQQIGCFRDLLYEERVENSIKRNNILRINISTFQRKYR